MNLRQIEVFRAIMITGSVSDASRLLHVSVPAVSRVLSHAESQLDFPLFERIKGRLHPTEEARQLYREIELVYRGVQRVDRLTHELAERRHGMLSIVTSPSIGHMLIPLAISRFHARYPDVRVHFRYLHYQSLKEHLLSRQSEVGVSILPVDHPNLATTPIARGRLLCICSPDSPLSSRESVTPLDLQSQRLITYPPDTPFGAHIEQLFADWKEPLQVAMEVGSPQNACALVDAGAGVALVDEFSLQAWPVARFMTIPVQGASPIVADLVHLRTGPLSATADSFVRELRGVLSERGLGLSA
ncbi:MAG TPA: LysR family transcriptional regulator [Castellaniella sp.]|uniref:LysR family transcriptional regulator n=1 Tax=Castellaniella sp. TaxID=1955812 RepID=UPI002F049422